MKLSQMHIHVLVCCSLAPGQSFTHDPKKTLHSETYKKKIAKVIVILSSKKPWKHRIISL